MKSAAYRVHRLIQDLNRDQAAAKRFAAEPDPVFAQYGLTADEQRLLKDGTPKALMELGVHPNLQMKFFKLKGGPPKAPGPGPLDFYLKSLKDGA